jgi:hypothetical protein
MGVVIRITMITTAGIMDMVRATIPALLSAALATGMTIDTMGTQTIMDIPDFMDPQDIMDLHHMAGLVGMADLAAIPAVWAEGDSAGIAEQPVVVEFSPKYALSRRFMRHSGRHRRDTGLEHVQRVEPAGDAIRRQGDRHSAAIFHGTRDH